MGWATTAHCNLSGAPGSIFPEDHGSVSLAFGEDFIDTLDFQVAGSLSSGPHATEGTIRIACSAQPQHVVQPPGTLLMRVSSSDVTAVAVQELEATYEVVD